MKKRYNPKWVDLQKNDELILQIVNSYGVASAGQIYALMGSSDQYLNRRLRKLSLPKFDYLRRLEQRIGLGHFLYSLGKSGMKWLASHDLSPQRRVFSFHTLYRSQVRACLTVACQELDIELRAWYPESRTFGRIIRHYKVQTGQERILSIIPDDFFVIKGQEFNFFFVELDISSSSKTYARKMQDYEILWLLSQKSGLPFQGYEIKDFKVLSIIDTKQRMINLKKATGKACTNNDLFFFTTYENFDLKNPENSLGEIWETPNGDEYSLI